MADQYYEPETIYTSGAIITVRRPILTDEERAKRMKAIHDAAANLLRSEYERKKKLCKTQVQ
jgi:hypothetical protein